MTRAQRKASGLKGDLGRFASPPKTKKARQPRKQKKQEEKPLLSSPIPTLASPSRGTLTAPASILLMPRTPSSGNRVFFGDVYAREYDIVSGGGGGVPSDGGFAVGFGWEHSDHHVGSLQQHESSRKKRKKELLHLIL